MKKLGLIVTLQDELPHVDVEALREAIGDMPGVLSVYGPYLGSVDECPECEAEAATKQ